jgi:hypothetical protein
LANAILQGKVEVIKTLLEGGCDPLERAEVEIYKERVTVVRYYLAVL